MFDFLKQQMKRIFGTSIIIFDLMMIGCASISSDLYYGNLAKEKSFEYFFPVSDFTKTFATIDETYEFVKTASSKFSQNVSTKRRDKGLPAKLQGPSVNGGSVTLVCLILASNANGVIDLSDDNTKLAATLQTSEDALLFFFIFYNGRAISLSSFYLDPKYGGYTDGNTQTKRFGILGNTYEANYPIGWSIEKAFGYLRGEIN